MKPSTKHIKLLFLLLSSVFLILNSFSQDIHFSQFYRTPMLINPALTGTFNGDVRVLLNHKDQWRNVGPYRTSGISCDLSFFKKKWKKAFLAGGLAVFNDQVGNFKLATTNVQLSVSSIIVLNDKNKVSAGLQGGFAQQSIDNTQLQWGNQYDPSYSGGYNSNLVSNEQQFENYNYGDFSVGVSWDYGKNISSFSGNKQLRANAGFAVHHLNRPKLEFSSQIDKLHMNFVAHAGTYIGIQNTNIAVLPSVLYQRQGPAQELNGGLMMRYTVKEGSKYTGIFKEMAVLAGGYYRAGDAVIPSFGFEFSNFAIGISYDVNVSSLTTASSGRGGLEISLSYINPNPFRTQSGKQNVKFL